MVKPIYEFCPKFEVCAVNDCPLIRGQYKGDSSDPFRKCFISSHRRRTLKRKYALWLKIPEKERPLNFQREKKMKQAINTIREKTSKRVKCKNE